VLAEHGERVKSADDLAMPVLADPFVDRVQLERLRLPNQVSSDIVSWGARFSFAAASLRREIRDNGVCYMEY
jgi:hypothetical protein